MTAKVSLARKQKRQRRGPRWRQKRKRQPRGLELEKYVPRAPPLIKTRPCQSPVMCVGSRATAPFFWDLVENDNHLQYLPREPRPGSCPRRLLTRRPPRAELNQRQTPTRPATFASSARQNTP